MAAIPASDADQNSQLWALVEKQRTLIFSLKDAIRARDREAALWRLLFARAILQTKAAVGANAAMARDLELQITACLRDWAQSFLPLPFEQQSLTLLPVSVTSLLRALFLVLVNDSSPDWYNDIASALSMDTVSLRQMVSATSSATLLSSSNGTSAGNTLVSLPSPLQATAETTTGLGLQTPQSDAQSTTLSTTLMNAITQPPALPPKESSASAYTTPQSHVRLDSPVYTQNIQNVDNVSVPHSLLSGDSASSVNASLVNNGNTISTASDTHMKSISQPVPLITHIQSNLASVHSNVLSSSSILSPQSLTLRDSYLSYYDEAVTELNVEKQFTNELKSPKALNMEIPIEAKSTSVRPTLTLVNGITLPADKAYTLGIIRPSSVLDEKSQSPRRRVQFNDRTLVHETYCNDDADNNAYTYDYDDNQDNYATYDNSRRTNDREEDSNLSSENNEIQNVEVTAVDGKRPPRPRSQQLTSTFPVRSQASRAPFIQASQQVDESPPPRRHSRILPRDSIFLNQGYQPAVQFVNQQRISMLALRSDSPSPPPSMRTASFAASPRSSPQASSLQQTQSPLREVQSQESYTNMMTSRDPSLSNLHSYAATQQDMTTLASPTLSSPRGDIYANSQSQSPSYDSPKFTLPSFSASIVDLTPPPVLNGAKDKLDDTLVRLLATGDKAAIKQHLDSLDPRQVALLQQFLKGRINPSNGLQ